MPAMVSGIVTDDAPASYWLMFSLVPSDSPKVFANVDSAQFLLVFKVVTMSVLSLPDLYSGALGSSTMN